VADASTPKKSGNKFQAIAAVIIVAALVIGGLLLYTRPSSVSPVPSSIPSTPITTQFASIENCTYVITSTTQVNEGLIGRIYSSTITASYVTTASTNMTTGAVVTTTTSLSWTTTAVAYNPTIANGTNTAVLVGNPYIGEPYTVSCTYAK
jgi:hypothetical protein